MRRLALGILVAIVLGGMAATAVVVARQGIQGDEVPIIVRDGSMIITTSETFESTGSAYKHRAKGMHGNAFWVKVMPSTTCSDAPKGGRQVVIAYSKNGFKTTFAVDPNGKDGGAATTITPNRGAFTRTADGKRLQYPAKQDGGHLASVAMGDWSCALPANQQTEIRICTAEGRPECR